MKTYGWLSLRRKTDPELSLEPPILLGDRSNGEIYHRQTARERLIRRLVLERAEEGARRLGVDRRQFLASTCGMATTLAVINMVGCSGDGNGGLGGGPGDPGSDADAGGSYDTGRDTLDEAEQCRVGLDPSKEFIFDIQTHHFSDRPPSATYLGFLSTLPQAFCGKGVPGCYLRDEYIRKMFLESDTTVAVLSAIPAVDAENPLTNVEIGESRDVINMAAQSQRVVNHCMVLPNYQQAQQFEGMQQVHEKYKVGAWKCYTPWAPGGGGWWLDDAGSGIPFITRGLALGVKTFCCHKGLPLPGFSAIHTDPKDVGPAAKMFPDANFVIYHSAYQFGGGGAEGPYQPGSKVGINALITSLIDAGVGANRNVYGELGTTWQQVMNDPNQAAHVIGKLLKYVGEDNVVWGTDSIWYGSPQPQIEAFLRFQITPQFQQMYGYPAITDAIRRKVLGLNAARVYGIDPLAMRCKIMTGALHLFKRELDGELGPRRWAFQRPAVGTRRDFFELLRRQGGLPG
jgi:hypothetical protein